MSKTLDDSWLYAHVPEAEEAMLCALTEEEHTFSKGFARKMRGLLRYERRSPFGRAAARTGRIAAAVLAAVLALNLILVGTVEAYREQAWQLIRRVTRKYTEFRIETTPTAPTSPFVPIDPPYIPEGYEETETQTNANMQQIIYSSENGTAFILCQRAITEGTIVVDTENANMQKINISGYDVQFITEGEMTQIYWICGEYSFGLVGNADFKDLRAIAENILNIFEK